MCISIVFFYFLVLFNTFTPKWFALSTATISAELRAILHTKCAKFYNFCAALLMLCTAANSAQNSVRAELHNSDMPSCNKGLP